MESAEAQHGRPSFFQARQPRTFRIDPTMYRPVGLAGPQVRAPPILPPVHRSLTAERHAATAVARTLPGRRVPWPERCRRVEACGHRPRWRWRWWPGFGSIPRPMAVSPSPGMRAGVIAGAPDRVTQHVIGGIDARHPSGEAAAFTSIAASPIGVVLARKFAPTPLDLLVGGVWANVEHLVGVTPERRSWHDS